VEQAEAIRTALILFGLIGIIFGGLSAIATQNAKRMLAYSSIAQIGFILVAIGWGINTALVAALVFTFNHALIKSSLMMLTGIVGSHTSSSTSGFSTITGMGRSTPFTGALFLVGGLALSGIPPTNGFISKMLLFGSGIDAEQWWPLAILGVASILTLVYTTRAFMRIWWQSPESDDSPRSLTDHILAPTLLILLVLVLGIWAEPLIAVTQATAAWLGDPTLYIEAVLGG
jgi:multicomponent Na+:H+ antiporter subunit D